MKKNNLTSQYLRLSISIITMIFGILLFKSPMFGLINPILYFSIVFMGLGFMNLAVYFIYRTENDYETLSTSLVDFLVGFFLFVFKGHQTAIILGASITLFTFCDFLNRGYILSRKKETESIEWYIRLIEMIILVFLGCLVSNNLYRAISVTTMIFSYFFIVYGLVTCVTQLAIIFNIVLDLETEQNKRKEKLLAKKNGTIKKEVKAEAKIDTTKEESKKVEEKKTVKAEEPKKTEEKKTNITPKPENKGTNKKPAQKKPEPKAKTASTPAKKQNTASKVSTTSTQKTSTKKVVPKSNVVKKEIKSTNSKNNGTKKTPTQNVNKTATNKTVKKNSTSKTNKTTKTNPAKKNK